MIAEALELHGNPIYLGRLGVVFHAGLVATVVGAAGTALDEYVRLMSEGPTTGFGVMTPQHRTTTPTTCAITARDKRSAMRPRRSSFGAGDDLGRHRTSARLHERGRRCRLPGATVPPATDVAVGLNQTPLGGVMGVVSLLGFRTEPGRLADHLADIGRSARPSSTARLAGGELPNNRRRRRRRHHDSHQLREQRRLGRRFPAGPGRREVSRVLAARRRPVARRCKSRVHCSPTSTRTTNRALTGLAASFCPRSGGRARPSDGVHGKRHDGLVTSRSGRSPAMQSLIGAHPLTVL